MARTRKTTTTVACARCRDTGVLHYLRDQGAPWARYVPVKGSPPCDCEKGRQRCATVPPAADALEGT